MWNSNPDFSDPAMFGDPNLHKNPSFFHMIGNMQVPPTSGFVPWISPGQHFEQQRMIATPPPETLSPDVVQETQPEDMVESSRGRGKRVQETQPVDMAESARGRGRGRGRRVHRRKPPEEPRLTNSGIHRTADEQYALAKVWLHVTEDPCVSNYQEKGEYWHRISVYFHGLLEQPDGTRGQDSLQGKWRKLQKAVQAFNEVHTRIVNNKKSGESDTDVIMRAMQEYNAIFPNFGYLKEWELLRASSKFKTVFLVQGLRTRGRSSKKSRSNSGTESGSGSDARVHIDLNDSEKYSL